MSSKINRSEGKGRLDYDLISKDYEVNDLDDDSMFKIKKALDCLSIPERRVFLTYCEYGTYTETAREFNVSPPTVKQYLEDIRTKLKNKIK